MFVCLVVFDYYSNNNVFENTKYSYLSFHKAIEITLVAIVRINNNCMILNHKEDVLILLLRNK